MKKKNFFKFQRVPPVVEKNFEKKIWKKYIFKISFGELDKKEKINKKKKKNFL